jgi:hypothetical protein
VENRKTARLSPIYGVGIFSALLSGMNIWLALQNVNEWIELAVESVVSENYQYLSASSVEERPTWGDLLILDLAQPVSNFELLYNRLREVRGDMPMVVLGERSHPMMRNFFWEPGRVLFMGMNWAVNDLERVLHRVVQRFDTQHATQTKGPRPAENSETDPDGGEHALFGLSTVKLPDVLQMLCLSGWTGSLYVVNRSSDVSGHIFIHRGAVVHADTATRQAEQACYEMLSWHDVRFSFSEKYHSVVRSIRLSWEGILIESARLTDEQARASLKSRQLG